MPALPFVDAHVHLWQLDGLRYPWLTPPFDDAGPNGSVAPIVRDYLLSDYLNEASAWDVRGIVHVEAGADPRDALAETIWLQDMADTHGMPDAIVAHAALDDPNVERLLAAHASHPAVRGIRHIVNWHPDPRRTYTPRDVTKDAAWQHGFALLAKYGLLFDLQCYPGQLATLAPLFARHPDTPVIVNHAGMSVGADETALAEWHAGMTALAALPHVSVKLSGMGFVDRDWTDKLARAHALRTIDLFGVERVMMASDFPTDLLFSSFDRTLGALAAAVADFPRDDQMALFAGNAIRWYRLEIDLG